MTTTVRPQPLHPAKFSDPILARLDALIRTEYRRRRTDLDGRSLLVLDPFAGVGRIHQLATAGKVETVGIEIEAPWAACHQDTIHADAFEWMRQRSGYRTTGGYAGNGGYERWNLFDVVATSPTYGNRYSDHHNAQDGSNRRSYTHDLGQPLQPNNSGRLPWGPKYWGFHAEAYRLMHDVLRPGGLLLLNVSDFYKHKQLIAATEWHRGAAMGAGFIHGGRDHHINTKRLNGHGAKSTSARAEYETILQLRRSEHS